MHKNKLMRKLLLLAILCIGSFSYAQQEIKLDIYDGLALKTLEASYEYYLNEQSSLGISALFNFEKESADFRYKENWMITPYFRHYFTNGRVWNLFGEAFFGISSGQKEIEDTNTFVKYSDGALGIAVGSKYTSRGGFVIDIHGGLGRNLFTSDSPVIVPRIGINIGWRF